MRDEREKGSLELKYGNQSRCVDALLYLGGVIGCDAIDVVRFDMDRRSIHLEMCHMTCAHRYTFVPRLVSMHVRYEWGSRTIQFQEDMFHHVMKRIMGTEELFSDVNNIQLRWNNLRHELFLTFHGPVRVEYVPCVSEIRLVCRVGCVMEI